MICLLVVIMAAAVWLLPSGTLSGWLVLVKENTFHLLSLLLWDVYFHGLGMWRGQEPPAICAQLTGVPEAHWRAHPRECQERLQVQFKGFVVGVGTPLLVFLLYRAACGLGWYLFVFQPMVQALGTAERGRRGARDSPTRALLTKLLARLSPPPRGGQDLVRA